jgi:hypothetical protein
MRDRKNIKEKITMFDVNKVRKDFPTLRGQLVNTI